MLIGGFILLVAGLLAAVIVIRDQAAFESLVIIQEALGASPRTAFWMSVGLVMSFLVMGLLVLYASSRRRSV